MARAMGGRVVYGIYGSFGMSMRILDCLCEATVLADLAQDGDLSRVTLKLALRVGARIAMSERDVHRLCQIWADDYGNPVLRRHAAEELYRLLRKSAANDKPEDNLSAIRAARTSLEPRPMRWSSRRRGGPRKKRS